MPGRAELDFTSAWDLVTSSEVAWSYSYPTREATTPWLHLSICLSLFPLGCAGKKQLGVPHRGEGTGPGAQPALGGGPGMAFCRRSCLGRLTSSPGLSWDCTGQKGKKSQPEHRHGQFSLDYGRSHGWRLGCSVSQEGLGPGPVPTPPRATLSPAPALLPRQGPRRQTERKQEGAGAQSGRRVSAGSHTSASRHLSDLQAGCREVQGCPQAHPPPSGELPIPAAGMRGQRAPPGGCPRTRVPPAPRGQGPPLLAQP